MRKLVEIRSLLHTRKDMQKSGLRHAVGGIPGHIHHPDPGPGRILQVNDIHTGSRYAYQLQVFGRLHVLTAYLNLIYQHNISL